MCLSTHVSKQTFKMQKISLHVINEAVPVSLGFLQTISVVVIEGVCSNIQTALWELDCVLWQLFNS